MRAGLPEALERVVATVVAQAGLPLPAREEVGRELRAHFEDGLAAGRTVDELLASFGDPAEAARRIRDARARGHSARRRRLGEAVRTAAGEVTRELRRAVRALIREPGFSLVVVLTLALGVGANTAVFTVLDAVMLEPLPYAEPDRLVRVYDVWHEEPDVLHDYLRGPGVLAYAGWDQVFDTLGAFYTYREIGADLTSAEVPERIVVSRVGPGFFETLGVRPALGRGFTLQESVRVGTEETTSPIPAVAVLSYRLWGQLFAGDPGRLGSTIELDGVAHEVVGVMPRGFENPIGSQPDVWLPQDLTPGGRNSWGNFYLTGVARLRDGLTLDAAQQRADVLAERLAQEVPDNAGWGVRLRPLHADIVGARSARVMWVLAAAVGLILLSACVNVANLVFARSLSRDRDVALRGALGSGRGRLMLHMLSESVVLATLGSLAGLVLGTLGIRFLLGLAPDALPLVSAPEFSLRVFVAGMASAVFALLVFGLAPAIRLSRTAPSDVLRAGGRSGTESRALRRVRGTLVVGQVAVAVVLVAGAGLLLRSFAALQAVELGVDDRDVLTFEVHLPETRYIDGPARHALHVQLHDRVAALPGVESVGATSWLPVNGRYNTWGVAWVGAGWSGVFDGEDETWILSDIRVVAGDYFEALDLELVRGEPFTRPDPDGARVVWVNEEVAGSAELGGADILGEMVQVGGEARRVVGIYANAAHDPRGTRSPQTFIPHAHFSDDRNWPLTQVVEARPGADLGQLRERIRSELAGLDAQLVLYRSRPLETLLAASRAEDRFSALLMSLFAVLALVIAGVGAYGVLAGSVARRRREIGIRMALGAAPPLVRRMVMLAAVRLTVVGVALGLVATWMASRWLEALLFGVAAVDPVVYVVGASLLLALGALAGWLPARRATRVDPAASLLAE